MRIISGTYRSRRLVTPAGLATRPTSDRRRETLFNVLAARIPGRIFADLYAGSGANGIEAISRGAEFVYFVENDLAAIEAIRGNLKSLGIASDFSIETRSASAALRRLSQSSKRLDIVFLDPPYERVEEYTTTLSLLGVECENLLTVESIVIAEHRRKQPLNEQYGKLQRYRVLEQGDAALSFYSVMQ